MLLAIFLSGALLFSIEKQSSQYEQTYPDTDCDQILEQVHHDHELLEELAKEQWSYSQSSYGGIDIDDMSLEKLVCHCQHVEHDKGFWRAINLQNKVKAIDENGHEFLVEGYLC